MSPPPFRRCVEVERDEIGFRYRLQLRADDAYFAGHFPGQPVLPGVGQLHLLTEALSTSLQRPVYWTKVHAIRFRKPILPELRCEITVQRPDQDGEVKFEIRGEDGVMADGRFTIANATADLEQERASHG